MSDLSDLLHYASDLGYSRHQRHHLAVNYRLAAAEFDAVRGVIPIRRSKEYFAERHEHCLYKLLGWFARYKPEDIYR